MKNMPLWVAASLLLTLIAQPSTASAQGTAFTYQGQLQSNGSPASGIYALTFTLFNTNAGGVALAVPVTNNAVAVTNGLFTTTIDFGSGVFLGATNWLQIGVATNGVTSFTPLVPRQQLTPTPYAIYSATAGNAATATSATTAGSATSATSATTATTATSFSGSLAGDVTGPQSATVVSANLPRLNGTNTFTGTNTFQGVTLATNSNNVIVGTFTGNGIGLTNLDASQLVSIGNTNGVNSNNFFVGPAGNSITSGHQNTANGVVALGGISSGYNNTANGYAALSENGIGTNNTADGSQALAFNRSGNKNTALGYDALLELGLNNGAGGTNNLALGNLAGSAFALNESGNIDIGNAGVPGDNNLIRLGDPNVQTTTFIAGVINGNGGGLTNLNANSLSSGTVPLAQLGGITSNQLIAATWQLATNLNGGNATLASNVVSGINITNAFITNSVFAGNGGGLTNLNASQLVSGVIPTNVLPGFQGPNYSTIGGGQGNTVSGNYSTVSGGQNNNAIDGYNGSTIGGGTGNTAYGGFSTVGGGGGNTAGGDAATVPGGDLNLASGSYSFAAGLMAQATNRGAFVWADSQGLAFASTNNDSFNVRARGGLYFATSGAGMTIDGQSVLTGTSSLNAANLTGALPAISGASLTSLPANVALLGASQSFTGGNSFTSTTIVTNSANTVSLNVYGSRTGGYPFPVSIFQNLTSSSSAAPALRVVGGTGNSPDGALSVSSSTPVGTPNSLIAEFGNPSSFVLVITNDGSLFSSSNLVAAGDVYARGVKLTSDRNAKENFANVNAGEVLAKVAALPVSEWNYKSDTAATRHIGPVAQDFHAVFGLDGGDDKHISTVDEGGVALAAIQGLNQKLNEKDAEIQTLKRQNDSMAERLNELEAAVKRLAANK